MTQLLREHRAAQPAERDAPVETGVLEALRELFLNDLHIEMPSPETDLLGTAVMDSLMLVELLVAIEDRFGLRLELRELSLDDIRSPHSIAALIAAHAERPPLRLER
jgi:acyl carrier protein